MRLHPQAVEYYKLGMTTEPTTTPTDWAASFDGGATWVTAVDLDGLSGWLVAGPDADTPGSATVLGTGMLRPLIRHVDFPETIVRVAPSIVVSR